MFEKKETGFGLAMIVGYILILINCLICLIGIGSVFVIIYGLVYDFNRAVAIATA